MKPITRRNFLRAAGVSLALPLLDAMATAKPAAVPRRFVGICTTLGLHGPNLFPAETGRDYTLTPYLEVLRDFRRDFTLFSGLSHPQVQEGHAADVCFLTAARHPGRPGFRNSISMDQLAVEQLLPDTRYPSLALGTQVATSTLSFTRNGTGVPTEISPARLFARLFVEGTPAQTRAQVNRLQEGRSIMDAMQSEMKDLQQSVGARDRQKLDEYFGAVREVEQRLHRAEAWVARPKPRVNVAAPTDIANAADFVGRTRLMFDFIHLALQNDSTRFVTLHITDTSWVPPIPGVNRAWHDLTHHGRDPDKLAQLRLVELAQMRALGDLLAKLKRSAEGDGTLLDNTALLFGSNMGNANSHTTANLPILLAGGGFRHGQHLAFDPTRPPPLSNLYVTLLQRLGVNADRFGSSTGTLTGLATVG